MGTICPQSQNGPMRDGCDAWLWNCDWRVLQVASNENWVAENRIALDTKETGHSWYSILPILSRK